MIHNKLIEANNVYHYYLHLESLTRIYMRMECLQDKTVSCPWCGERFSVLLDLSVPHQDYVEDCQVCCSPIVFDVTVDFDGDVNVTVSREGG